MTLPVADSWYSREEVSPGITCISEPFVDVLLRANIWHVRGRDHDVVIDAGNGIAPLKLAFTDILDDERTPLILTHTHVDHMGAAHEFSERWVHTVEADTLADPGRSASLLSESFDPELRAMFVAAGYPPLPEIVIGALPFEGYVPAEYRLEGAPATRLLNDGDVIDMGDRRLEVLLVPGHSPGSIALWDAATGTLFAGDVVYDGPLLYQGRGMSVLDYIASFRRLRALPVTVVHAGHEASFGRERLHAIIDEYMRRWDAA